MLYYFRKYVDNISRSVPESVVLGAACGSVAGIVGLYQVCSYNSDKLWLDECKNSLSPLITREAQKAAIIAGALSGSVVGFVAGSVVYPIYNGFIGWCRSNIQQRRNMEIEAIEENELNAVRVERP